MSDIAPTDLGVTGLRHSAGVIYEEFHRDLHGPRGQQIYREMGDNDPIVGSALLTIDLMARQTDFLVKPVDETPQAAEVADFVHSALWGMRVSWPDTLSSFLTMIQYGWSWHMPIYVPRADGRIVWRELAPRSQTSLVRWQFDETRQMMTAMVQQDWSTGRTYTLDRERSLHTRTSARLDNPEGRSCLRTAYLPWWRKNHHEDLESIGVERDLVGLPKATAPMAFMQEGASDDQKAVVSTMRTMVRTVRRNEAEGVMLPSDVDPTSGNPLFDLTLMTSGGARQFDIDKIVARYEARILMATLTDFILLGHEGTSGGFGITNTDPKIAVFSAALDGYLDVICAELTQRAVPALCTLNGIRPELHPSIEHGPVQKATLSEVVEMISKLAGAGAPLFPDDVLMAHVLEQAGLPSSLQGAGEVL